MQDAKERAAYAQAAKVGESTKQAPQSHPINVDQPGRAAPAPKAPAGPEHELLKFSVEGQYFTAQVYIAQGTAKVSREVFEVRSAPHPANHQ